MIIDHGTIFSVWRRLYAVTYQFFASRRSSDYALAQENRYLARLGKSQTSERLAP